MDNSPGEDRQHIWHDIIASSPEMRGLLHTLFDASSEEVYFLSAQLFLREGGDEEDRTMTRTGWHQVRPPDTPNAKHAKRNRSQLTKRGWSGLCGYRGDGSGSCDAVDRSDCHDNRVDAGVCQGQPPRADL